MSELQEAAATQAAKFEREVDHLLAQCEGIEQAEAIHPEQASLATQTAKRVRREATILLKALAQLRDDLQANGGYKDNDGRSNKA